MFDRRSVFDALAGWVTSEATIPAAARENAKRGVLDLIGVTLAARQERVGAVLDAVHPSNDGPDGATVIGWGRQAHPQVAAFRNGALGHALDFDDSSSDLGGHPTAVVFPAAFAVAESVGASGAELLDAHVRGVEIAAALGRALNPSHYDSGWHPTATLGAFGATAAAGRLLGLSSNSLAQAFGLTAALCSGIKVSFGTLAKPLQVGRAAMNGVAAAQLIAGGADARSTAFEAEQGFLAVLERTDRSPTVSLPGVDGSPWSLALPGLIIKQYPCCGSTHSAIDAALDVRERLLGGEITQVRIGLHPKRRTHVDRPDPGSGLDAKFSVQYVVARALLLGAVRLDDFDDGAVGDPEVRRVMGLTTVVGLDAPDARVEDRYLAAVSVTTTTGEAEIRLPMAKGRTPGSTLPDDAIFAKFADCCRHAFDPQRRDQLRAAVLGLDRVPDTRSLAELVELDPQYVWKET